MKRYEYLVAHLVHRRVLTANDHWLGEIDPGQDRATESCPDLLTYLEHAGAQGWELVTVDPEGGGSALLYFKREHVA